MMMEMVRIRMCLGMKMRTDKVYLNHLSQWRRVHGNNFGYRIEDDDMDKRITMRMTIISLTIKSISPQLVEEGTWEQLWPHDLGRKDEDGRMRTRIMIKRTIALLESR